jgi:2-polyprenyl-3-methyl-5-hydroxy-6-metoxy-1,4-benzoquinol methylase
MSRDYNDYWSSLQTSHNSHPGNRFRYELIVEELRAASVQPARVLDCGCGDGSLLSVVAARIPCGELFGTDVADNVPVHRAGVPIRFQCQDLGQPVPESMHGLYDVVLCSEVIEHVPNDEMVLLNLKDLAAPGGIVVLTTQSGNIYKTEQFLGHLRHYRLGDLCTRVEQTGLRVEKSYLAGWPWLNAQKIAAHYLQRTVQKNIVQAQRLSVGVRAIFAILMQLCKLSSRRSGPQIVIVARKPKSG